MYTPDSRPNLRPHAGPQTASKAPEDQPNGNLPESVHSNSRNLLLLGLALALQLVTLSRIDGYLLADSIEYMDRAHQFSVGIPLDSTTGRSFAFSALLTPIFWFTSLFPSAPGLAPALCRTLVILLGLLTVSAVCNLGTRLFNRRAGLVAGFALAVNPAFLQFGVEPLSGAAATLAVTLALSQALTPGAPNWKRGLKCGAWLGVALMMAFKTIPIGALMILCLMVFGRWKERALWTCAMAGFGVVTFLQCLLDKAIYGQFGSSLLSYLSENVFGLMAGILSTLHKLGVPGAYDLGSRLYAMREHGEVTTTADTVDQVISSLTTRTWYLENLTAHFIVWPLAIALALGLLSTITKRQRPALIIAIVLLGNFTVFSIKSSKSFRLLIPLLPFAALLIGLGLSGAADLIHKRIGQSTARAGVCALAAWALIAGQITLAGTNLSMYGSWWQAAAQVESLAEARGEQWNFASAYNWAVRFRTGRRLTLNKVPHPLYRWPELTAEEREASIATIEAQDAFIAHRQVITQDQGAMRRINARFYIHDILYDAATFEDLGPVFVMVKRDPEAGAQRSFFELHRDADPGAYQAGIQHPYSVDYRRRQPDGPTLQMVLLGWDLETDIAEGQIAWLTLHWYTGQTDGHDYTVVSRLTDRDNRAIEGNHKFASGAWPSSALEPGWILAESLPIIMPLNPSVFGGADARGDLMPAKLWLNIAEFKQREDGSIFQPGGLNPFRPSGLAPIPRPAPGIRISGGHLWSPNDNLFQIGGLWLPVPDASRLADDGVSLAPGPKKALPATKD